MFDGFYQPTFIADFTQVQSIVITGNTSNESKWNVQMRIANAVEPLTVSCNSQIVAENMASLIEGYYQFVTGDTSLSIWKGSGSVFSAFLIL